MQKNLCLATALSVTGLAGLYQVLIENNTGACSARTPRVTISTLLTISSRSCHQRTSEWNVPWVLTDSCTIGRGQTWISMSELKRPIKSAGNEDSLWSWVVTPHLELSLVSCFTLHCCCVSCWSLLIFFELFCKGDLGQVSYAKEIFHLHGTPWLNKATWKLNLKCSFNLFQYNLKSVYGGIIF